VLDVAAYRQRRSQTFASINLTLISVIQGVALYVLTFQTYSYVSAAHGDISAVASLAPFSVASFVFICIATFEYTWFIVVFQWPPTVLDIAIPLLLGFFEILQIYFFFPLTSWTLASAILCFAGALAYLYSYFTLLPLHKVDIEQSLNDPARKALAPYFAINISICVLCGLFLLVMGLYVLPNHLIDLIDVSPEFPPLLLAGIFIALELVILYRAARLLTKLDSIFKLT
jgi:hypothetical protein